MGTVDGNASASARVRTNRRGVALIVMNSFGP
jgi:hypothetical protein